MHRLEDQFEELIEDEEDDLEGRILDRLIFTCYVMMAGLAIVILAFMHLLGA